MNLELFDPFPVTTRAPSKREVVLAGDGAIRSIVTYANHRALLEAILPDGEPAGAANSTLRDSLNDSVIYRSWQQAMPRLKDVRNIGEFRVNKLTDVSMVNEELLKHGSFIPRG